MFHRDRHFNHDIDKAANETHKDWKRAWSRLPGGKLWRFKAETLIKYPTPAPCFFAGEESSNPALFKAHPPPYSSKPNVLINVSINWRSLLHVLVLIFSCTSLAASFFPPLLSTSALRLALRAKYPRSPCFPYVPYALVSRKPRTLIPGECGALAGYFSGFWLPLLPRWRGFQQH